MKKSVLALCAALAVSGAASLHAADAPASGYSSTTTAPKADRGITVRSKKSREAEAQKGVTYGGIATDLYRKGPVLFSPLAPKGTEAGKHYSNGLSADGPNELAGNHEAQKPIAGGWNLFSIEF
ncbi:MAG TPA: hypothetical protein VIM58_10800 [Candidatus Methylacidiphilales bacterium]